MTYVERMFYNAIQLISTTVTSGGELLTALTAKRVTKALTQVLWATANNLSIAAAGTGTSDAHTFDANSFAATVQLKAKNNGTPASGDRVEFYLLNTNGDPDAAESADEYDTTTQGTLLAVLDTFVTDPAITTVVISPVSKGYKIYAVNRAASNGITVSAQVYEAKA